MALKWLRPLQLLRGTDSKFMPMLSYPRILAINARTAQGAVVAPDQKYSEVTASQQNREAKLYMYKYSRLLEEDLLIQINSGSAGHGVEPLWDK